MLSAHDNPEFQAMCREHEIEGAAMVALCGLFWDRAIATHAGAAAEPSDEQIMALWRECSIPTDENDHTTGPLPFARALLALTSAPAEPDAYNRRLRAQLEQEWADLQRLKNAYTPAETPPAAGAVDAREQEQISALIVRALRAADMQLSAWENGYAFDSHGPSREAQRLVTEALAALPASFGEKQQ